MGGPGIIISRETLKKGDNLNLKSISTFWLIDEC
jgi:hypothetical protein